MRNASATRLARRSVSTARIADAPDERPDPVLRLIAAFARGPESFDRALLQTLNASEAPRPASVFVCDFCGDETPTPRSHHADLDRRPLCAACWAEKDRGVRVYIERFGTACE